MNAVAPDFFSQARLSLPPDGELGKIDPAKPAAIAGYPENAVHHGAARRRSRSPRQPRSAPSTRLDEIDAIAHL